MFLESHWLNSKNQNLLLQSDKVCNSKHEKYFHTIKIVVKCAENSLLRWAPLNIYIDNHQQQKYTFIFVSNTKFCKLTQRLSASYLMAMLLNKILKFWKWKAITSKAKNYAGCRSSLCMFNWSSTKKSFFRPYAKYFHGLSLLCMFAFTFRIREQEQILLNTI